MLNNTMLGHRQWELIKDDYSVFTILDSPFLWQIRPWIQRRIVFIALWGGLLAGFIYLDIEPYYFIAAQAFIDAILILIVFGGDILIM